MGKIKKIGAATYIETVYGTRNFARSLDLNDADSIMNLMDDFSDHNLKKSKAYELLEMLKKLATKVDEMFDRFENEIPDGLEEFIVPYIAKADLLIKEATNHETKP